VIVYEQTGTVKFLLSIQQKVPLSSPSFCSAGIFSQNSLEAEFFHAASKRSTFPKMRENKRLLRGRCAEKPLVLPQSHDESISDGRFRLSTNEELYVTINATSFSTLKRVKGKP